jgi:hypothetical protein
VGLPEASAGAGRDLRRSAGLYRHVVERLVALVGVDAEAAVGLEQNHAVAGTEPGDGAAVIGDLTAGDEDPHAGLR